MIKKVLTLSLFFVMGAFAGDLSGGHHVIPVHKVVHEPVVVHPPHPYEFGYEIKDGYGTTQHRHESGDEHNNKHGSYGYTDPHGVYRKVNYIADAHGFRAWIKTNEPGTANQDPAAVKFETQQSPIIHVPVKKVVHEEHGYGYH